MRFLLTFIISIFLIQACNAEPKNRLTIVDNISDFTCNALINTSLGKAKFIFKDVNVDDKFQWNNDTTKENIAEYQILVFFDEINIQVGFSYFKHKGGVKEGSLSSLLNEGQISLFKHTDDDMDILDTYGESSLQISSIENDILIEVDNEKGTNAIFTSDISNVNFWIIPYGYPALKCKTEFKLEGT